MNHLHDRLHQAADDTARPLTTEVPALLERARASRQRQRRLRAVGSLGGAAALTAAAVVLVPVLAGGPTSGEPTPAPSNPVASTVPQSKALSDAEVVLRCEPQLEKYFDYPMYVPTSWRVAHDREYAVGDLVQLEAPEFRSNPVLCVIPERGQEQQEVPFTRFAASVDEPARLAELCSESFTSATRGETWVDLRRAEVVAADGDQDVTVALLRLGNAYHFCSISSPTWDSGLTDVYASGRGDVYLNASTTGSSNKSIVEEPASYYTGAGLTDPDARMIRVTFVDGHVEERPVHDGAYAVMIRVPGEGGLLNQTIEVLGAGGQVLEKFPPM